MKLRLILALVLLPAVGASAQLLSAFDSPDLTPWASPPVITQICASTSSPCTVTSSAAIDDLVVACGLTESGTSVTKPTDSAGNTWPGSPDVYALNSTQAQIWCFSKKLTAGYTSGSSTVTWGTFSQSWIVVKITGLTTGALDQVASATQTTTSAYTSGATSALTGSNDMCLGIAGATSSRTMSSAGSGFAILNDGSGIVNDTRDQSMEDGVFTSGAVTAAATLSGSGNGVMVTACYK